MHGTVQLVPSQTASQARATIAANIDRGITARGWTNRATGEKIGATEHDVWRWRSGRHTPALSTQAALADVLFDGDLSQLYVEGAA
jgi:transcriptional regulator with XRE-family HTH domain